MIGAAMTHLNRDGLVLLTKLCIEEILDSRKVMVHWLSQAKKKKSWA